MDIEKQSKGIKGGKRHGAGRKAGIPNKRTAEIQQKVEASGLTPLDYMLSVMRDEANEAPQRLAAANMAAPYVHAKLSAVDVRGSGENGELEVLKEITIRLVEPSGS